MKRHRSMRRTAALLVLTGAVVAAPSFAFADRDHGKSRREYRERDERRGDRDGRWDRRDRDDRRERRDRDDRWDQRGHDREVRWVRPHSHYRGCGHRDVRVVEVIRRPAPRFTVAVQFGQPACPAPVYYAPPAPAYCPPPPVCATTAPACGAYYDPYCGARYTSFELYLEHVSRSHGISVALRN